MTFFQLKPTRKRSVHAGETGPEERGVGRYRLLLIGFLALTLGVSFPIKSAALAPNDFFAVKVVNARTGQAIPMVKLTTNNDINYYTDSAGLAAIYEPGLMGKKIRLSLESHGYASAGPGWNNDVTVTLTPGKSRMIEMTPHNVADRLYRKNGFGVYRDSHLLGGETPIDNPLVNDGEVMGQDSVNNAVFRGELYWFWDDTHRRGNHRLSRTTGATSSLPSKGGLDPEKGVNLDHHVGDEGHVVNLFPDSMGDWIWMTSLMVVEDESGVEQMFSVYLVVEDRSRGIARWNGHRKQWEHVTKFPPDHRIVLDSMRPFRVRSEGREWFYFARPYTTVRVPATAEALSDPDRYEALTPLREGTRLSDESVELDDRGNPVWGWKPRTSSLHSVQRRRRLRKMDDFDTTYDLTPLRGIDGRRTLLSNRGTVYWNEHRDKWIMIVQEVWGEFSALGDIWYAEADSPIGPWTYARRIVRHNNYSCYNPKQHRMLDQLDGKRIFFECTYASWMAKKQPASYNSYNQMMYSLNLSDTQLHLPSPVYRYRDAARAYRYDTLKGLSRGAGGPEDAGPSGTNSYAGGDPDADSVAKHAPIPFYALPADRPRTRSVAVWSQKVRQGVVRLTLEPPADALSDSPAFYAYPPGEDLNNPHLAGIYEYEHQTSGRLMYAATDPGPEWYRSHLVFQAWNSPNKQPPREPAAEPVRTCMGASAVCESIRQ